MKLWRFHRYRQPRLCVDAVERDASGRALILRQGLQTYRLAFDDAAAAAQIAQELETLSETDAPLWDLLREGAAGEGWDTLAEFLDTHSLIGEAYGAADGFLADRSRRIAACIVDTASVARKGLSRDRLAALADHALHLRQGLKTASTPTAFGADGDPFDAAVEPNFFLALLAVELEYFRGASPLTLIAADGLLTCLSGEQGADLDLAGRADFAEACALYDAQDMEAHLWLVAQCLVASTGKDARRLPTPPIPALGLSSGLEFMRQTEILTRTALADWGRNPYVVALDALGDVYSPLIAGPFIEQYHVTRRFVEIIAPLLSKRLCGPLRSMMFQYYSEEVGHEALESTTCEAMGVSQSALDNMLPLPLHFAFVDALTLLAKLDPISSLASIMVIEGVFGEPPKMSLRLAAIARTNPAFRDITGDHDELNETLNHNSISRDAFENIAAVTPATQDRVMRRILFLLELNQRAWGGIADFYGPQRELRLQGRLGRPLSPNGVIAGAEKSVRAAYATA